MERDAEDDCSAPVVAAEDDVGEAKVRGERSDVVGRALEGVVGWGVWGRGEGIAHHVGDYDAQVQGQKERDLTGWSLVGISSVRNLYVETLKEKSFQLK
jgi:hypothetical protein